MTTNVLLKLIIQNLDSRNLKKPNIRKNATKTIIAFIEATDKYLKDEHLVLPDRKTFEEDYIRYKMTNINGGEKHIISMIYTFYNNASISKAVKYIKTSSINTMNLMQDCTTIPEKDLIQGVFTPVKDLYEGYAIPCVPGIYCIKLREEAMLPEKYGKLREDRIIYIGIASKSLKERLWEEELKWLAGARLQEEP